MSIQKKAFYEVSNYESNVFNESSSLLVYQGRGSSIAKDKVESIDFNKRIPVNLNTKVKLNNFEKTITVNSYKSIEKQKYCPFSDSNLKTIKSRWANDSNKGPEFKIPTH